MNGKSSVVAIALMTCLLAGLTLENRAQEGEGRKTLFLPKNPIAAAYVLGRLSNQELIEAPRGEFVYTALLQRKGLERKYRLEALEGLAKLRETDPVTEAIRALGELDAKGEDFLPVISDLGGLLLQNSPSNLSSRKSAIIALASQGQLPFTKQVALAALITAGEAETLWKESESNPEELALLIGAVPLVKNPQTRASFYPKVAPLLNETAPQEARRAAISSLAAIPGHDLETFRSLAPLLKKETDRAAAIVSLQQIPRKSWPVEDLEPLIEGLIPDLKKVPESQQSEPDFSNAIQFAGELAALLPKEKAASFAKTLRGMGVTVFVVRTLHEQMLYDRQLMVVEAGKTMEIVLINDDSMPHNLVVLMPNSVEEIGTIAEKMPLEPDAEGRIYVPNSPKVLRATKMVDPGQKAKLSFTAPSEPGDYGYVCTFPGHWRRMFGKLVVVRDVEAYLAANATTLEPQITEWKLADLAPDLAMPAPHRSSAAGRQLFITLGCLQCHKMGGEGMIYGPDLTDAFKRYNNDRVELTRQILEPSAKIEEKYRTYEIETRDGESVFGMIAKEDVDNLVLQTGPAANQILTIKKSDIKARSLQTSSPMPLGLLNTISKEQILDLLAFIESGGQLDAHEHHH